MTCSIQHKISVEDLVLGPISYFKAGKTNIYLQSLGASTQGCTRNARAVPHVLLQFLTQFLATSTSPTSGPAPTTSRSTSSGSRIFQASSAVQACSSGEKCQQKRLFHRWLCRLQSVTCPSHTFQSSTQFGKDKRMYQEDFVFQVHFHYITLSLSPSHTHYHNHITHIKHMPCHITITT